VGNPSAGGCIDAVGTNARFYAAVSMALASTGDLFVSDNSCGLIRKVTPAGAVTTLAGGTYDTLDGTGTDAGFKGNWGITVDSADTLYVAEYDGASIRKVTTSGVVTTFAGTCAFETHTSALNSNRVGALPLQLFMQAPAVGVTRRVPGRPCNCKVSLV
jgi:hypothetical protein